jgi:cysteine sulfinate desulfinase/cysteine desulfurase-like protein
MGRRAGTENVPYIVEMGEAATLVSSGPKLVQNVVRMEELRTRLIQNLTKDLGADRIRVNVPQDAKPQQLPNILSVVT